MPEAIRKNLVGREILFLYGNGICSGCPPGRFLNNLKSRTDILIIVPKEFSNADVKNLRNVFSLRCKIIKSNEEIEKLLRKIAACKKTKSREKNFLIELSKSRKIDLIRLI
jgi:hypothetical protein